MPSYSRKVQLPGKNAKELYDRVTTEIERFMDKIPIGKFDLERDPAKCEIRIKSAMFSGALLCADGALELSGNLSFLASPFRSKLDEGVDRWVSKTFGT